MCGKSSTWKYQGAPRYVSTGNEALKDCNQKTTYCYYSHCFSEVPLYKRTKLLVGTDPGPGGIHCDVR